METGSSSPDGAAAPAAGPGHAESVYGEYGLRIRIAPGFWTSRFGIALLGSVLALLLAATGFFAYYYIQFGRMIDEHLTRQIYQNTSRVFSGPGHIFVGEKLRPADLASYLRRAGYQESAVPGSPGVYRISGST